MKWAHIFQSFLDTLEDFFVNTTLPGFSFLLVLKNKPAQYCAWGLILLGLFGFTGYVLFFAWLGFTENPTITILKSQVYPVTNLHFPAVGICSVNKLSKKAVARSETIPNNETSPEGLRRQIHLLGALVDGAEIDEEDATNFQDILDKHEGDEQYGDIKKILQALAPSCEDITLKCQWQGQNFNCSELFNIIPTPDGFCCAFNHVRTETFKIKNDPLHVSTKGTNKGLVVLLNSSNDDYSYASKNIIGYSVKIFNSLNFPDISTGSVRELIVDPSEEVNAIITVSKLHSKETIRQFTTNQRKCYFADERYSEFGKYYSNCDCLTKCKIDSILALCNCVPYYAPAYLLLNEGNPTFCTLIHMTCLNKYKVKWSTYRPESDIEGLEKEMEDSLDCSTCLPLCTNTFYNFAVTSTVMQTLGSRRTNWGILKGIENLTDMSLLRVYYGTSTATLYRKNIAYNWYEVIGYFGGLLGICLGCSIISIAEIVYFLTIKFYENITKPQIENLGKRKNKKVFQ